jgi:hypothetical protein
MRADNFQLKVRIKPPPKILDAHETVCVAPKPESLSFPVAVITIAGEEIS